MRFNDLPSRLYNIIIKFMMVQLCGRFEGYYNIYINEYIKRKHVQYIIN